MPDVEEEGVQRWGCNVVGEPHYRKSQSFFFFFFLPSPRGFIIVSSFPFQTRSMPLI